MIMTSMMQIMPELQELCASHDLPLSVENMKVDSLTTLSSPKQSDVASSPIPPPVVHDSNALFAKELHKGQFRSAAPWEERPAYIVHPLRNAIRLIRWGSKDPNVILAGILHDTLEDCAEKYCDARGIQYASENEAREILYKKLKKDYGSRATEITLKLSNDIQSEEEDDSEH